MMKEKIDLGGKWMVFNCLFFFKWNKKMLSLLKKLSFWINVII